MKAVSVSADVAWSLLHGGCRVLNMPTPAPLPQCTDCTGEGWGQPLSPYLRIASSHGENRLWSQFQNPCHACAGTGVGPLRLLLHATSEWDSDRAALSGVGGEFRVSEAGGYAIHHHQSYVDGGPLAITVAHFDAVVAVVTITASHEQRIEGGVLGCCDRDFEWSPWASHKPGTHHWRVGEVEPIDPIPWERVYECGPCHGTGKLDHMLHTPKGTTCQQCEGMPMVWDAPPVLLKALPPAVG